MGQINVEGVGVVDIKGDTPTFSEMADIKSRAEALKADNILTDEGDKEAQNFFTSPAFGRLVLEAGLSIGGVVATGGLALPAVAARTGMLARPFITKLLKSSLGAAGGGGTGAALAQTFDPRENLTKEIVRGAAEGAVAEFVGAPVVIKGAQLFSRMGSMPMKRPELLQDAIKVEDKLKYKSRDILLRNAAAKGDEKLYNKLLSEYKNELKKEGIPDGDELTKFDSFEDALLKKPQTYDADLLDAAKEMRQGLTAGVKTKNRFIEILENISQKSLVGGGAITKRYLSASMIGDQLAEELVQQVAKEAKDPYQLSKFLLQSIGEKGTTGSSIRSTHRALSQANYEQLEKIMGTQAYKNVFPVKKIADQLFKIPKITEGLKPDLISPTMAPQLAKSANIITSQMTAKGNVSFNKLRQIISELGEESSKLKAQGNNLAYRQTSIALKQLDDVLADEKYVKFFSKDASEAYKKARAFKEEGEDFFRLGVVKSILSKANDESLASVEGAYTSLIKGGSGKSLAQLKLELNKLTKLKNVDGTAVLKPAQVKEIEENIKGTFLTELLGPASVLRVGKAQFGPAPVQKAALDNYLRKNSGLAKEAMGNDYGKLKELQKTIGFSQGDLSQIAGLPGGVLIQMRQAGAAQQLIQFATPIQIGAAFGTAMTGLPMASLVIIGGPALMAKALTSSTTNRVLFPRGAQEIAKKIPFNQVTKGAPLNDLEQAANVTALYRQAVGRLFTDGIIPEEERDRALASADEYERQLGIGTQRKTTAQKVRELPNIPRVNFNTGISGGTASPNSRVALAGNDPLLQGIAANQPVRAKEGGIINAKKN